MAFILKNFKTSLIDGKLLLFTSSLKKNIKERASAAELLGHPWILRKEVFDADICEWLFQIRNEILPKTITNKKTQITKTIQTI
jgi:hypothetical protein